MTKKILFSLFAIFLCYRTSVLMKNLLGAEVSSISTISSLTISFLLSLYVTGVFAFLGFSFKTSKLLPNSFYRIKNPTSLKNIYDFLGVNNFRKLLMIAYWGKKSNRKKYFDGTRDGIPNLIFQSKQSEFGHSAAFMVVLLLSIVLLSFGFVKIFVITNIINTFGNLYPVILQRQHRSRIERISLRYSTERFE